MNEENTQNVQQIESAQTTVSQNEIYVGAENETNELESQSVSQGDITNVESNTGNAEMEAYTDIPYDDTLLLQKIDTLVNANVCIIFIVLFVWVESRIRNAVWRYFGHGKSD